MLFEPPDRHQNPHHVAYRLPTYPHLFAALKSDEVRSNTNGHLGTNNFEKVTANLSARFIVDGSLPSGEERSQSIYLDHPIPKQEFIRRPSTLSQIP